MDNQTPSYNPNAPSSMPSMSNSVIITILVILLVLSLLGVNVLHFFGAMLQQITDWLNPALSVIFKDLGYTSGNLLKTTGDLATAAGKTGLDIVNGTIHDVGDLLLKASNRSMADSEPVPTSAANPVVTPSSAKWCYVGEYESRRGCVEVSNENQCISGQVFDNKNECIGA